jgi:hypothetical protein
MNATTADADAQTDVIADRTIYAAYSVQGRTYTVRFYNGSTLLETDTGVPYGGSTTYNGATPVSPDGSAEDYPFEGWQPAPTNIQGDTSCYAQFGSPVEDVEITDSWDTIIASIDAGTYATKYKIGNYKPLDLGSQGTVDMQIVAFDTDNKADGSGKAKVTWISKDLLNNTHVMNGSRKTVDGETAYTAGGWEHCEMRAFLKDTIKPLIPETVRNAIVPVTKVQAIYTNDAVVNDGQTTSDDVWIPGHREIFNTTSYETTGPVYSTVFTNANSRIKNHNGSASYWWLRAASSAGSFRSVNNAGAGNYSYASGGGGVALGFCT